ncbi:MAG: fructosamine kinase family protein [Chloroflexota bacterium]
MQTQARIEQITGVPVTALRPLHGGSIGQVYRADLRDGRAVAVKVAGGDGTLDLEGEMLRYLSQRSSLPVPDVLHAEPGLLIMSFIPGGSDLNSDVQRHAADLLAELHSIPAPHFGFERATLIGGLRQPNPWTDSWVAFFRDHRLLYMAGEARRAGRLPANLHRRIESFAARVGELITEPDQPALIHGDMWTTNILAQDGRVTGFVDPAVYYAHPEIELAFSTLFGTFGDAFFDRYNELRPIAPGFFEQRRDIYNLYPLLVHVRLFGAGYVGSVERILREAGF